MRQFPLIHVTKRYPFHDLNRLRWWRIEDETFGRKPEAECQESRPLVSIHKRVVAHKGMRTRRCLCNRRQVSRLSTDSLERPRNSRLNATYVKDPWRATAELKGQVV